MTFVVNNTGDSGPGTLRQALLDADADTSNRVDNIVFEIPASTAANLNVPVPGFDPITQTWTIAPASALPVITHPVTIDGYTEANTGLDYRYPGQITSAVQWLTIAGAPTGGTFTLTTSAPLPVGITPPIAYSATPAQVQQALVMILGAGNVSVTEGTSITDVITFLGADADLAIPNLIAADDFTGAGNPSIQIQTVTVGGVPILNPTLIKSSTNSSPATSGNNAQVRVILNGNQTGGSTGLVLATSQSIIRGLAIEGFGVGVSIPSPRIWATWCREIRLESTWSIRSTRRRAWRCLRLIRLSLRGLAIQSKAFCWAQRMRRSAALKRRMPTSSAATASKGC